MAELTKGLQCLTLLTHLDLILWKYLQIVLIKK